MTEHPVATEPARYNGRTAEQLASDAEAALLGLVHLAENHDPPPSPEAVYRTLSGLTRMLDNLPEAVTRLRATAISHHRAAHLEVTSGTFAGNADAAIGALQEAVDAMLDSFGAVRTNLDNAQAALSGVTSST